MERARVRERVSRFLFEEPREKRKKSASKTKPFSDSPNLARRFRPGGNRREDLFLCASCVPRGSRGDGGRGGGAGARATRASGDGCARVAETSRASPRGRAREDARARASRPPRATLEKNRGTETRMRAKRRGDGRGLSWDFKGSSPCRTGRCPPSARVTWKTYLRVLG